MSVVDLPKKTLTPLSAKCSAISITKRKQPAFFFFIIQTKANQAGQSFPTPHAKGKGRREGEKREGGQWGKMGSF